MKSVLIITPYFAPQTHAAVFRAHKLAKYLPDHGWKPYVLTVDTNYLYNEDPGLLEELPEEVEIVRAPYIEPTIRGVRMALGGEDRTFVSHKSSLLARGSTASALASRSSTSLLRSALGGAYSTILQRYVQVPDAYRTWYRPAVRIGRQLIERHSIDVIYSTALPLTAHQVAHRLQRLGPAWVADFRDPITYGAKSSSGSESVLVKQRAVMRETLRSADAVTSTSSSYPLIFHDIYGELENGPVRFIPTGVDDNLIAQNSPPALEVESLPYPYVVYVGEIMPDQNEQFFSVFAHAVKYAKRRFSLLVVGHELMNRKRLALLIERYGLEGHIVFLDHMPQRDLYQLIQNAAAGILAPGSHSYWWNNHAKLVDYVGLRKPVLALVPDPSEARSVLTKTGLGVFLDGDAKQAGSKLTSFLNGVLPAPTPVPEECDKYLASTQVQSFVDVFESLL